MLAGGDAAVTLLAFQRPAAISALPPRNGRPPNVYGTVYDASQCSGLDTGSTTPAVTGPLTNALMVGSAPSALNAPSFGVCATVCVLSSPLDGASVPGEGFSSVSVNSRSSQGLGGFSSASSLVRIWLIAFWLPLARRGAVDARRSRSSTGAAPGTPAVNPANAWSAVHCCAQLTTAEHPVPGTPYSKIVVKCFLPQVASLPPPHGFGWTTSKTKRSSPAVTGKLVIVPL